MNSIFKLFQILPSMLRLVWFLLLVGTAILTGGYVLGESWQNYAGLASILLGYIILFVDMGLRNRHRPHASGFYAGAMVAPFIGLFVLVVLGVIGAIVFGVQTIISGYSKAEAIRLIQLLAIVFPFTVVIAIPCLAFRSNNRAVSSTEIQV